MLLSGSPGAGQKPGCYKGATTLGQEPPAPASHRTAQAPPDNTPSSPAPWKGKGTEPLEREGGTPGGPPLSPTIRGSFVVQAPSPKAQGHNGGAPPPFCQPAGASQMPAALMTERHPNFLTQAKSPLCNAPRRHRNAHGAGGSDAREGHRRRHDERWIARRQPGCR